MSTRNDIIDTIVYQLTDMQDNEDGWPVLAKVYPYEASLQELSAKGNHLFVVDTGRRELRAEDTTDQQFAWDIAFIAYSRQGTYEECRANCNGVIDNVEKWLNARPNLGDNVGSIRFLNGDNAYWDPDEKRGMIRIFVRVIYWETKATSEAAGTDVYGTGFINAGTDALYALIDALKTTMAAYDPTFSYVYKQHDVAKIQLNAVTIDLARAISDYAARGTDVVVDYPMVFTVRVHTGYIGDPFDSRETISLLTSIVNKLKQNIIGVVYRIDDATEIETSQEFPESGTIGGQLQVQVSRTISYTQAS